jgi:hypothetical protein
VLHAPVGVAEVGALGQEQVERFGVGRELLGAEILGCTHHTYTQRERERINSTRARGQHESDGYGYGTPS